MTTPKIFTCWKIPFQSTRIIKLPESNKQQMYGSFEGFARKKNEVHEVWGPLCHIRTLDAHIQKEGAF